MPHEPLLLVPGLMCDQTVWQPVLPLLSENADCVVVGPGDADSLGCLPGADTGVVRPPG